MKTEIRNISCLEKNPKSNRKSPFLVVYYEMKYETSADDRSLIDSLLNEAKLLSKNVNPAPANCEGEFRTRDIIYANAIAGVVSEYFWLKYINKNDQFVKKTKFTCASAQIDLVTTKHNKLIEVRSSFPRNGIDFAICHPCKEFDVLGPYANKTYKPGEIDKDFYVRTLFPLSKPADIISAIVKDSFQVFLTGGATSEMMRSDKYSFVKNLKPEDSLSTENATDYRVVPFSKALDTVQITELIRHI